MRRIIKQTVTTVTTTTWTITWVDEQTPPAQTGTNDVRDNDEQTDDKRLDRPQQAKDGEA